MTPNSSKYKLAFTGTNCSGKTTMALEVTTRLKSEHHYLAEVVSSQDRKISWADAHFPVDPRAHYGMITNLIHAEVQAELKGDAAVVITDRSVLDLYAIALVDHPNSALIAALRPTVEAWVSTYTQIFYLPPLVYQADGKRPPDDFRMKTHTSLIRELTAGTYPNVTMVSDRSTVMSQVRATLGLASKNPSILAEAEKLQYIADAAQVTLYAKPRNWASSDLDVWYTPVAQTVNSKLDAHVRGLFRVVLGDSVTVSPMFLPASACEVLLQQHPTCVVYTPCQPNL